MSTKSKKTSKSLSKPNPNQVELQPDHAKVLRDASKEEKDAFVLLGQQSRRLREMERSYEHQRAELLRVIDALDKRIKDRQSNIMDIARSFQSFYELPPRNGWEWQLNIDEGVWERVSLEQKGG